MKRLVAVASLVVLLITVFAMVASAKGPANVVNGIHNLSTSGVDPLWGTPGSSGYASTNVSQVCVFCHTPHGGLTEGPLWNRALPGASAFTHYSSTTLSPDMQLYTVNRAVSDESRLCLSCHDGVLTLDHLINPPNELNGQPVRLGAGGWTDFTMVAGVPAVIGTNLGDDHPISFSYSDIVDQAAVYGAGGSRAGELHTVDEAKAAGLRFFGSGNRVECSSCHDPHVDYIAAPSYAPFLITPNSGSNLCRGCHNK